MKGRGEVEINCVCVTVFLNQALSFDLFPPDLGTAAVFFIYISLQRQMIKISKR